jgi:hypothetical protein
MKAVWYMSCSWTHDLSLNVSSTSFVAWLLLRDATTDDVRPGSVNLSILQFLLSAVEHTDSVGLLGMDHGQAHVTSACFQPFPIWLFTLP